jgi:PAS domain S-box-containing protein
LNSAATGLRSDARTAARPAHAQRRLLIVLAAALWAVAFVFAVLTDAVEVGALVFAPAVALVALLAGTVAGALAGLIAAGLYVTASFATGGELSLLSVASKTVPMLVVGAGIGRLSEWLTEGAQEVTQAQRETEAVEATFRAVFENALDAMLILDDDGRFLDANRAMAALLGVSRDELIGRRPEDFTPPENRGRLDELWRAFRERGTLRGDYEIIRPDGVRRSVEFSSTAHFLPGRHLSVVRDATERKRDRDALEQRAAQQADIAEFGLLALGGLEPTELMDEVVDRVGRTLGVTHVTVLERLPDGERLLLRAGAGWREGVIGQAIVRADRDSQAGWTLATSDPVVLKDLRTDLRFQGANLLREHGVISGLSVVIRGSDGPWGVLGVHTRSPRRFTGDDVNFLRAAANTLAMAIERGRDNEELRRRSAQIARLAADRQRIVAEALDAEDRTRERISQQLHDDLLQSLFAIRQDLAQAATTLERRDLVLRARDGVRDAIRSLRAAVFDLHPVVLDQGGLTSAIDAVARHHAELGGFEVSVEIAPEAGGEHDRLVLSLVRELLSNVARHAEARHAHVRVWQDAGELGVEVSDNGRGVDPVQAWQAVARGHIGLASAAQRVEALGGRLELDSHPGDGATVRGVIPLAAGRRPD